MEGFALIALVVIFLGIIALTTRVGVGTGKRSAIASAKFPPTFSSSLTANEVLSVVEERLKSMQSIRTKWKTTEKVEKVGRLQSMLTVPYNLSGGDIKISFLMNLLATKKDAGGCTVEWNYVMMSPLNNNPPEVLIFENEIYKKTTLEVRAALFEAQGDLEEAQFVQTQTGTTRKEIEIPAPREQLKRTPESVEVTPGQKQELFTDKLAQMQELFCDPDAQIDAPKKLAAPAVINIPGTPLPDIVGETLKAADGTSSDPSLMQTPEFQSVSLGGTPNPLNFTPPDPALSSVAHGASDTKCVKCSQARDPAFNFCLYCGHSDS